LAFVLLSGGGILAKREDNGDIVLRFVRPYTAIRSEVRVTATGVEADSSWGNVLSTHDSLAKRKCTRSIRHLDPISLETGVIYSRSTAREKLIAVIEEATRGRLAALGALLPVSFVPELIEQMAGPVTHLFEATGAPAKKRKRE
jgi:hypothetical protein